MEQTKTEQVLELSRSKIGRHFRQNVQHLQKQRISEHTSSVGRNDHDYCVAVQFTVVIFLVFLLKGSEKVCP